MKYLLYVFYIEIALTLVSGVQAFFTPAAFIAQFSDTPAPTLASEMARWYAVLLFVIAYLLYRALRTRGTVLTIVLQALLIGDVIHIVAAVVTANALGRWPLVVIASIVISIVLGVIRVICLWRPQQVGIERVA